jgi:hypothetical protein
MSEPENFLARWSRKKIESADDKSAEQTPERAAPESRDQPETPVAHETLKKEFDPATLPPLESIGAGTDIRAFLQAGVPAELSRAALRRAWTSDPAIRDFIGLAENSWDFTAPEGVPGFGPLKAADDIRRMVAEISGEFEKLEQHERPNDGQAAPAIRDSAGSEQAAAQQPEAVPDIGPEANEAVSANNDPSDRETQADVASHQIARNDRQPLPTPRRAHGKALPE